MTLLLLLLLLPGRLQLPQLAGAGRWVVLLLPLQLLLLLLHE